MNTIPSVFNFNSSSVRTAVINDEPWFVAADVCAVLGMKNHREAIRHLDDDEKGVISNDTLGGIQEMSVINESGLYSLVLRSRKPEARPFVKWVTREVLPAIRKTGQYIAQPYAVNPGDSLTKEQADTLRQMNTDAAIKAHPNDTKKQGVMIRAGWSKLKSHFKVSYRDIPQSEFIEAVSIISRHAVEGEYLPKQPAAEVDPEITPELLNTLALRELLKPGRRFMTLFSNHNAEPMPVLYAISPDALILSDREFITHVSNGFPANLLPALIQAVASRLTASLPKLAA